MVFQKVHVCSQHKKVIKYQALIDGLSYSKQWIPGSVSFVGRVREFLLRLSPLTHQLTHSCSPLPSMPKNLDKLKIHIQG